MDKYKLGARIHRSIPFIIVGTTCAWGGAVGITAAAVMHKRRSERAMSVGGRIANLLKEVLIQMKAGDLDSYTTQDENYSIIIMRQEK